MKLALLGDIHGNHVALHAALSAASSAEAKKLLITGDLVGYYYAPAEVLRLLQPWEKYLVRGNHEDMLSTAQSDPAFLAQVDVQYGTGLRTALEQLSTQQIDELCNLPHPLELIVDGCRILLCHGSPWDNSHYIYPDSKSDLFENFDASRYDLIVSGHTHYPMNLRIGKTMFVNPGSVGQPRNGKPGAQWAIFDTDQLSIQFFSEEYDASNLVDECKKRTPHLPYLANVLVRK